MRNQGLRIINYMINGRLIAYLPVKLSMTTKRTVMLLFCLSIFVSGSSAVKELMLGCLYKKQKLVFTYLSSGEGINICICNLISIKHIFLM